MLPLAVELLIVPLLVLLVGMQVVAGNDPATASAKRVIDTVLVAFGIGLTVWVAFRATTNLHGLLTRENGDDLLVAPVVTLAFVPFLQLVAWRSRREMENLRKRFPTTGAITHS